MEGIGNVLNCLPEPGNRVDRWAVLVKDDHGHTIGSVPKDICNIISVQSLVHHSVVWVVCVFMGEMVIHGVGGGGPKLKCVYLVQYNLNVNLHSIADHLHRHVDGDDICL